MQQCLEGAIAAAKKKVGDLCVKALGITNQRETTLVWDKSTGQALCKAIVWMDTRTQQICSEMTEALGSKAGLLLIQCNTKLCYSSLLKWPLGPQDHFRPVTGLPISTYFSAYKLKWLMANNKDVADAIKSKEAHLGNSRHMESCLSTPAAPLHNSKPCIRCCSVRP